MRTLYCSLPVKRELSRNLLPLFLLKRRVERHVAGGEVDVLDHLARLAGAVFAVHAAIFPFDRKRAGVTGGVQSADDFLEVDTSPAGRAKIPAAARVAEVEMTRQNAAAAIERNDGVFHMDVVHPVGKLADELDGVDSLPNQVAGIEVEAELLAVADGIERPASGEQVECDLSRMHLQRESHAAFAEDIEDWIPALGKLLEPIDDHRLRHGRERVEQMPDARTGKAIDDRDAEFLRGAGSVLHLFGGALIDTGGFAVAPNPRRENRLVPLINEVAYRLPDKVVADGVTLQVVPIEQVAFAGDVLAIGQGFVHLKVVAPTGEFQTLIAEVARLLGKLFERQIGPLSSKESDRSCHGRSPKLGVREMLRLCYTFGMRLICIAIGVALALATLASAAGRVELEIVTERGVQITAPQEWLQRLANAGITNVRLRGGRPGDEPRIESIGSEDRPVYLVTGLLLGRDEIVLPGGRFNARQTDKLRDYLDRVAADGPEAITAAKGRFDLTEKQFTETFDELSKVIKWETKGQTLAQLIDKARQATRLEWTIDPAASKSLRAAPPVADEAKGSTLGSGMAMLLRPAGLELRPTKPRGGEVELRIVVADPKAESWPVGWKLKKSPHETVPAMFQSINVEVEGYTLAEAIDAIAPRIKLPIRWDHITLAKNEIDPATIEVKLPRTRTYYKRILDLLLSQGRLKGELRVDEAGKVFYWVSR